MKITFPLAAAGFWCLAFLCSFPWFQNFVPEITAASLILLISATAIGDAGGVASRQWPLPRSSILLCGGLFWLLALVSMMASEVLFISWVYFFTFSVLPMSVGFFLLGSDSAERLQVAWRGVQIVLAGLSLYALWQYFFAHELLFEGRVHEPLTDPNGLAAILSLGLFMMLRTLLDRETRKPHDIILFFVVMAAFLTTGSRGAFVAFFLMMLVLLGGMGVKMLNRREWLTFGGLTLVAVFSVSLLTPTYFAGPLKMLYYSYENGWASVFGSRDVLWSSTIDLIKAHPFFGTGIGTFYLYYPEMRAPADTTAGFMAHNDPLQFGAEMGMGAVIIFYAVVALGVGRTITALQSIPKGDPRRLNVLLPALGLGALVLHSHLTFNLHVMACLMMTGFVLSFWHQATGAVIGEKSFILKASPLLNDLSLKTSFLLVAFVMGTLAAVPVLTQKLLREADISLLIGDIQKFADQVNLANTLSLKLNPQPYSMAARIPLGALMQTDVEVPEADRERMIGEAGTLLEKAARYNPRDVAILRQQAQLACIRHDSIQEEALLREALRLNPNYLSARVDLAGMLERSQRGDEALELLVQGADLNYDPRNRDALASYYTRTIQMLEAKGRKAETESIKNRLTRLVPQ